MFELTVVSGKGGTGKTSLVGSLSALAKNKIVVDCDVDAADLHLIIDHEIQRSNDFIAGSKAEVNQELCTGCGICVDYCRFDAIKYDRDYFHVLPLACEGCGVCRHFCPEDAIDFRPVKSGEWFVSKSRYGPFVHARLGIAQSNSGRLVSLLRQEARQIAAEKNLDMIIVDGPPGIGCPVIASITGADFVLLVTEPSLSAFHDMRRLIELIDHFEIRSGICINKYDINPDLSRKIEQFANEHELDVMGRIPFDNDITRAQVEGMNLIEFSDGQAAGQIKMLWEELKRRVNSFNIRTA